MDDRERLGAMRIALKAAANTVRREVCRGGSGECRIKGKGGHIITDGYSFYLYHHAQSGTAWTYAKKAMCFAALIHDGEDEGIWRLDRLPDELEANTIRHYLRIPMTRPPATNAFKPRQNADLSAKDGGQEGGPVG